MPPDSTNTLSNATPRSEPDAGDMDDIIRPAAAVGKAARYLADDGFLSSGDRAELRRISPDRPVTPALWKLLFQLKQDDAIGTVWKERRWAVLLMGMAHCAGLHDYDVPLGRALADAGWSEVRFVRLLEADADTLPVLVRRMAQYLASKQQPANWEDVRKLLFYGSGDTAEAIRLRIARSYYRTLYAKESEE